MINLIASGTKSALHLRAVIFPPVSRYGLVCARRKNFGTIKPGQWRYALFICLRGVDFRELSVSVVLSGMHVAVYLEL